MAWDTVGIVNSCNDEIELVTQLLTNWFGSNRCQRIYVGQLRCQYYLYKGFQVLNNQRLNTNLSNSWLRTNATADEQCNCWIHQYNATADEQTNS
ncbi:hypothetical protein F511_43817 [Dorcoceras hygrometricum]|uniref:Uncharacterized protein n=1 Tax=Dorcoceras hygrometricum TaxID=472368 RepID=A0A2Z7C3R5_9LAMI|nr:hypothetical protein F511_43817 [Dorcoceras hygrometricum]